MDSKWSGHKHHASLVLAYFTEMAEFLNGQQTQNQNIIDLVHRPRLVYD